MAQDLTQQIEDVAQEPRSAEVDGMRVESQSLDELIRADRYLRACQPRPMGGIRIARLIPPGAT